MQQGHDEIKETLPDYLRGILPPDGKDAVAAHLKKCAECREDLELLDGMLRVGVDDPGELFWKTLPQKVKGDIRKEEKVRSGKGPLFLRPFITAAAAVLAAIVLTYALSPDRKDDWQPAFFHDPLVPALLDYSGLVEEDIPVITDEILQHDLYDEWEDIPGYGYYRDLASLDAKEMGHLAEVLDEQKETGG